MRLNFQVEIMEFEDHYIAVPFGEGADAFRGILKVNEVGASILGLLSKDTTEEKIINALEKEYDASRDTISLDVRKFLSEFEERGLLNT